MSSIVHSADRPTCAMKPRAMRCGTSSETWPIEARALLALIVVVVAIGLLAICPDAARPSSKTLVAVPNLVLDANSAPPQVIQALPALGPTLASRWVAARKERPFVSLEDARRRVRGLGPVSARQITGYLTFRGPSLFPADRLPPELIADTKVEFAQSARIAAEHVSPLVTAAK
jgi:hypothetical protein